MDAAHLLRDAAALIAAPHDDVDALLSAMLRPVLAHRAVAVLTDDCGRTPMSAHGDDELVQHVTSAELARIAQRVQPGGAWHGHAALGGELRSVLAVAAAEHGALLVLALSDEDAPGDDAVAVVQGAWEVLAARVAMQVRSADVERLAVARAAGAERARLGRQLGDEHRGTLTALLRILRASHLADRAARETATQLAVDAILDLDAAVRREGADPRSAKQAFAALAHEFDAADARLELRAPGTDAALPTVVLQAAAAISRIAVTALTEAPGVTRLRLSWQVEDSLRVVVRDDGALDDAASDALAAEVADRAAVLGGHSSVERTDGWGGTLVAELPVLVADWAAVDVAATLNPREREVLGLVADGLSNRRIGDELGISQNTVKFHVSNVLSKLGVATRTQAALLAPAARASLARR